MQSQRHLDRRSSYYQQHLQQRQEQERSHEEGEIESTTTPTTTTARTSVRNSRVETKGIPYQQQHSLRQQQQQQQQYPSSYPSYGQQQHRSEQHQQQQWQPRRRWTNHERRWNSDSPLNHYQQQQLHYYNDQYHQQQQQQQQCDWRRTRRHEQQQQQQQDGPHHHHHHQYDNTEDFAPHPTITIRSPPSKKQRLGPAPTRNDSDCHEATFNVNVKNNERFLLHPQLGRRFVPKTGSDRNEQANSLSLPTTTLQIQQQQEQKIGSSSCTPTASLPSTTTTNNIPATIKTSGATATTATIAASKDSSSLDILVTDSEGTMDTPGVETASLTVSSNSSVQSSTLVTLASPPPLDDTTMDSTTTTTTTNHRPERMVVESILEGTTSTSTTTNLQRNKTQGNNDKNERIQQLGEGCCSSEVAMDESVSSSVQQQQQQQQRTKQSHNKDPLHSKRSTTHTLASTGPGRPPSIVEVNKQSSAPASPPRIAPSTEKTLTTQTKEESKATGKNQIATTTRIEPPQQQQATDKSITTTNKTAIQQPRELALQPGQNSSLASSGDETSKQQHNVATVPNLQQERQQREGRQKEDSNLTTSTSRTTKSAGSPPRTTPPVNSYNSNKSLKPKTVIPLHWLKPKIKKAAPTRVTTTTTASTTKTVGQPQKQPPATANNKTNADEMQSKKIPFKSVIGKVSGGETIAPNEPVPRQRSSPSSVESTVQQEGALARKEQKSESGSRAKNENRAGSTSNTAAEKQTTNERCKAKQSTNEQGSPKALANKAKKDESGFRGKNENRTGSTSNTAAEKRKTNERSKVKRKEQLTNEQGSPKALAKEGKNDKASESSKGSNVDATRKRKDQSSENTTGNIDTDSSIEGKRPRLDEASTIQIGCRVAVYWEGDGEYFEGTVTKERTKVNKHGQQITKHFVEYDDGDTRWENFGKRKYRLLRPDSISSPREDPAKTERLTNVHSNEKEGAPSMGSCNRQGNGKQLPAGVVTSDWVAPGLPWQTRDDYGQEVDDDSSSESDSETDDEEVHAWAMKMFGITPRQVSGRTRNNGLDACSAGNNNNAKQSINDGKHVAQDETREEPPAVIVPQCSRRKVDEALSEKEIAAILGEDGHVGESSNWVRRSVRQPCRSALEAPKLKTLLEKLRSNDSDMVVLKLKKYISDPNAPPIVIEAALDALEENTNCEALYIQNFNEGMRDEQVLRLLGILQQPSCKVWCLNIGETYRVRTKTWKKFARGLKRTKITHMYASEHTISSELKEKIRTTIRNNRSKHNMHMDPDNLDTIVRCTHCWWNPINAKALRPFLKKRGYEHILHDKEIQGLRGSTSGATLS